MIFDAAIFDSAIFDTGGSPPAPTGSGVHGRWRSPFPWAEIDREKWEEEGIMVIISSTDDDPFGG